METNTKRIYGKWKAGWALDNHTLSSTYLGDDRFETERTEIGEALYQLKYRNDKSQIDPIVNSAVEFMKTRLVTPYLKSIIPIPPSDTDRAFQPFQELAKKIGEELNLPIDLDFLTKTKSTSQLKEIFDPEERANILQDAFVVKDQRYKGRKVLLFDDLYRSGATMNEVTNALFEKGEVNNVYVLTITKTRSKR